MTPAHDGSSQSITSEVLCSVCIANYNGRKLLQRCLSSVLSQTLSAPIEIIIYDDASTDDSVDFIQKTFPQVKVIEAKENRGFCVANNRMAEIATGRYLLLLNNDAELFPDALETLRMAADSFGQPAILTLPQYNAEDGRLIDIGSQLDIFLNAVPIVSRPPVSVGMAIGACLWIPRTLWQSLGGFPEWFVAVAEDLYLCTYARVSGYRVHAIPHSGFRHWVGQSLGGGKIHSGNQLRTTRRRRALSERNKSFVMLMTYPTPLLQLVFPLHLLVLAIEGLVLAGTTRDFTIWRDIYGPCFEAIWRQRRKWKTQRHIIQKRRQISILEFCKPILLFPHKLRLLWRHGLPHIK